jgi:hypothetical protein
VGLESSLPKNITKKFNMFNISMMKVSHIKTLLATQRRQKQATQLLIIVFYTKAKRRGR